jgi:hypothetical protein
VAHSRRMGAHDEALACSPSRTTRAAVLAFTLVACAVPALAVFSRELAALRNWQYGLAALLFLAIVCARLSPPAPARVPDALRNVFLAALVLWMLAGESLNFLAMQVKGVDYSIFDWMLENTLRGRFMWSPIYELDHFGVHQNWPLIALVPLHALLRFPFALCLVNVGLLSLAAALLWRLAHQFLDDDLTAALAVIAFLTNPWTAQLLANGFRAESFFPLFIFLFVFAWKRGEARFLCVAALLLCSVKEDAPVYCLGFAIAAGFRRGRPRAGAMAVGLLASAVLVVDLLLGRSLALKSTGTPEPIYLGLWAQYGTGLCAIALAILTSPLQSLKTVLTSGWMRLYAPALFLPLASWECLGAMAPGVVMLGLAASPPVRDFTGYHPVPLACAAICGVLAVGQAHRAWPWGPTAARTALLLFPLFGVGYFRIGWPVAEERRGLSDVRAALSSVTQPLCAQAILFPQLGYPKDLRPLFAGQCERLRGSLSVVNAQLDPWPFTQEELEGRIAAARRDGRAREFRGGFLILR